MLRQPGFLLPCLTPDPTDGNPIDEAQELDDLEREIEDKFDAIRKCQAPQPVGLSAAVRECEEEHGALDMDDEEEEEDELADEEANEEDMDLGDESDVEGFEEVSDEDETGAY